MQLTLKQESIIKSLYKRHGRKKHGLCICEGERCCKEIIESRPELIQLAICSEDYQNPWEELDIIKIPESKMKKLTNTVCPQGILIVAKIPEANSLQAGPEGPFIVIADKISDPGNLGTMLRTVRAVGLREFFYTAGTADPYNDKVIRSAMGAQFYLNLNEYSILQQAVDDMRRFGYKSVYRTDPHCGRNCFKEKGLFDKSLIIFGGEARGAGEVSGAIPLKIPMPGNIESLNVAQALTVVLFEFVKIT